MFTDTDTEDYESSAVTGATGLMSPRKAVAKPPRSFVFMSTTPQPVAQKPDVKRGWTVPTDWKTTQMATPDAEVTAKWTRQQQDKAQEALLKAESKYHIPTQSRRMKEKERAAKGLLPEDTPRPDGPGALGNWRSGEPASSSKASSVTYLPSAKRKVSPGNAPVLPDRHLDD